MMWKIVIITGASRGFGRACAVSFAKSSAFQKDHCQFILTGQDAAQLNATAEEINAVRTSKDALTRIKIVPANLSNLDGLEVAAVELFDNLLQPGEKCSEISFISNAGSLGVLAPVGDNTHKLSAFAAAINLNVTSTLFLSSEFIKRLPQSFD